MRKIKILLLTGLLISGAALIFLRFENSKVAEIETEKPVETSIAKPSPDSRFDRTERDDKLQAQADALLSLFDSMDSVPIYVKDDPIIKNGSKTESGVALTDCDEQKFPVIFMKKVFYRHAPQIQITNILKHELTHAWLCRRQLMSTGHGTEFQGKFKQVGGSGN